MMIDCHFRGLFKCCRIVRHYHAGVILPAIESSNLPVRIPADPVFRRSARRRCRIRPPSLQLGRHLGLQTSNWKLLCLSELLLLCNSDLNRSLLHFENASRQFTKFRLANS